MSQSNEASNATRRQFLQQSSAAIASTTVLASAAPAVHAGEDNTIRLALIGCGSRGTGAVVNAFNTRGQGPIQLYAMADLDRDNINRKLVVLTRAECGPSRCL